MVGTVTNLKPAKCIASATFKVYLPQNTILTRILTNNERRNLQSPRDDRTSRRETQVDTTRDRSQMVRAPLCAENQGRERRHHHWRVELEAAGRKHHRSGEGSIARRGGSGTRQYLERCYQGELSVVLAIDAFNLLMNMTRWNENEE